MEEKKHKSEEQRKKKKNTIISGLKINVTKYYLGYLLTEEGYFYLYDVEKKKTDRIYLGNIKQHGCDDFMVNSLYFLMGGYDDAKKVFSIDVENNFERKDRADMNVGRFYFDSNTVDYEHIYVLGGRDIGRYLSSCEKYSIAKDKWLVIKPLNMPRDCINSGIMSNRYIYAIEGRSYNGFVRIIERLDTLDEEQGWEQFHIYPPDLTREAKSGCWCLQLNGTDLLIAGGTRTFDDRAVDEAWIFNTRTKEIKPHTTHLPVGAELYTPCVMRKSWCYQLSYCYDRPGYNLIQFNFLTKAFKVTESKSLWKLRPYTH